jgi:hypothetical protein
MEDEEEYLSQIMSDYIAAIENNRRVLRWKTILVVVGIILFCFLVLGLIILACARLSFLG